jgi:RNA-directed DNA polymerase
MPIAGFDDLYNLVCDPAFLLVASRRVRGNKGARTAGVDVQTAHAIEAGRGVAALLEDLRAELKAQRFEPLPGQGADDPQAGNAQAPPARDSRCPGPRRPGRAEAGARADL